MSLRPRPKIQLQPINWVQRIALYVTHSRCYLVGSNNTQTAFKLLKIDRTNDELSLVDDRVEYTYQEIRDLLMRIDHGNITKSNGPPGVSKTVSSFGLLGFVRFLHGYYLILIIKRRKVASIGYHTIYKVEDTKLVYIPNQPPKDYVSDEAKYVKAFQSIDLTSNFYFSYSYDITHTLQYNLCPVRGARFFQEYWRKQREQKKHQETSEGEGSCKNDEQENSSTIGNDKILVKSKPAYRFAWNSHLIDFEELHDDWKIYLIHGFVAQANISVYSKPLYVTLIARRSKRYSGTRFLKRGLNLSGDVANEVETEQIVHDASVSDFTAGFYTSFVQLRGSMPDRWSQDVTKIVAKPQIIQDYVDPYHEPTAKHFNDLLGRYGTPVVVLNLVKKHENKPHESILNDMLHCSVSYLNQFLPQHHIIRLIAFDMARCSKSRNKNVMQRLGKIGFNIVRVTGIFQSWKPTRRSNLDNTYTLQLRQHTFSRQPSSSKIGGYRLRSGLCLQNGVVRVNCVDSLDRTNTAQFVLGKVALAFQLQALGVLMEPNLEYDTDAVRLLEQLYEDHGDTIALQYGGSQLVHRVKTYRKVAPLTSHSSEIMQTLSRYYRNTFSDAEKQNVINLFLGVRKALPTNAQSILSNLASDYYLHNEILLEPFHLDGHRSNANYRQWWNRKYLRSLPHAYSEYDKESSCFQLEIREDLMTLFERVDYFLEAYRPFEISYLSSSFPLQILSTIRDYMPSGSYNPSPFCLRLGPGKIKEIYMRQSSKSSKKLPPNPSVYGLPSTSSASSDMSSLVSDDYDDDDDEACEVQGQRRGLSMDASQRSRLRGDNNDTRECSKIFDNSTTQSSIMNAGSFLTSIIDSDISQNDEPNNNKLMRFIQNNQQKNQSISRPASNNEPDMSGRCGLSSIYGGYQIENSQNRDEELFARLLPREPSANDMEIYQDYVNITSEKSAVTDGRRRSQGRASHEFSRQLIQTTIRSNYPPEFNLEELESKATLDIEHHLEESFKCQIRGEPSASIRYYTSYLDTRELATPAISLAT